MLDVLIDGHAATSGRTSGWERYARILVAELERDSRGLAVDVAEPRPGTNRLRWEHDELPRLGRGARLVHLPAAPPSPRLAAPTLTTVHDATLLFHPEWCSRGGRWYYRHATRHVLRRRDASILTITDAARADLLLAGADPGRTYLARIGLDADTTEVADAAGLPTDVAEAVGAPAGAPYLLHIGTIEPRKNVPSLLDAWRRVEWPDGGPRPLLVLCGRHGWGDRHELPPGVVATGAVSDEQLRSLLRGAVALVSASSYEGFGLPLLEALAIGQLAVVSDIPAHREVGADAPRYVSPTDVDAIAAALVDAFAVDDRERRRRAMLGRSRATELRAAAFVDEVVDVYTTILALQPGVVR